MPLPQPSVTRDSQPVSLYAHKISRLSDDELNAEIERLRRKAALFPKKKFPDYLRLVK